MKTLKLLILFVFLIGTISCQKEENINNDQGLNFCSIENTAETIVRNNDIIGYDSTKHIFRITETAWNMIEDEITPSYPDPLFGFNITLNNETIYCARYIPGYYSMSYSDVIIFMLIEPDLVYIDLGYPSPDLFTGIDYRNDSRIIAQLKKENKLIEIED